MIIFIHNVLHRFNMAKILFIAGIWWPRTVQVYHLGLDIAFKLENGSGGSCAGSGMKPVTEAVRVGGVPCLVLYV